MTNRPRIIDPLTRVSAWLADIDDWDASDAEVFIASIDKAPARSVHVSTARDPRKLLG